ncbi:MAG: twin-arginine translocation signal domain-containing protein [Gallionella sp.]
MNAKIFESKIDLSRRRFLQTAGLAFAVIPIVVARPAHAMNNVPLRARLQYQNTPKNDMSCVSCLEFIPGKTNQDLGACKIIPNDDEIAPNAYCTGWNTM